MDTKSEQFLKVSELANQKIFELFQNENNDQMKLRVFVAGGACAGLIYGFSFDEKLNDDDTVVIQSLGEGRTIQLVMDPVSVQYLFGAEVDCKINEAGETQYIIRNPNVQTTCACGGH